ncbi:MAG: hypothetical protein F4X57_03535 [Chloroflexi bacterium]|nr:hypothetical protein [Chloroflexota bacterium]
MMDRETIETLITDILGCEGMLLVIDSGGAVSEMHAPPTITAEFAGRWANIEAGEWHIHLDMDSIAGAQFVENSNHGHESMMAKLYYLRFSDADESTLLRFYFPNPWLDEDERPTEFQPERLRVFEDFRSRYTGKDGIVFVQRTADGDIYHND